MKKMLLFFSLLCLLLLASCGKKPAAVTGDPPLTAPPTSAQTETPVPAETSAPAETPAPTETLVPTAAPDPGSGSAGPKGGTEIEGTPPAWISLPEGAGWLSDRELAIWGAWFSEDFIRDQFLYSTYSRPEDVDIMQVFYNGPGREVPPADLTDVRAFLLRYGTWNQWTDVDKLPAEVLDDVISDYTGLRLEETNRVGMYMLSYVPETDCYYNFHGDTNRQPDPIFLYGWQQGDDVALYYEGFAPGASRWLEGLFRVTLRLTPGDWRFTANEYCQVENGAVTYVSEPDPWHPETDGSGNVTVEIPRRDEELSMRGLEPALDMVRSRFADKEEDALSYCWTAGSEEALYCFMLGTTAEGKTEAWFVGGDGSVLPLPVPEDIPADEIYYETEPLLLQVYYSRYFEDGGVSSSLSFLVPTGELFIRDQPW